MAEWIARYYAAGLPTVLEAMLPPALRSGLRSRTTRLLSPGTRPTAAEREALGRRAPRQAALLDLVYQQLNPVDRGLALRRSAASASALAALLRTGWIRESESVVDREAYADNWGRSELVAAAPPDLTEGQQAALKTLRADLARGTYHTTLLHGVTGSGKTEVYLRLMEDVTSAGGGVLFLVPEVALAPQTVGRIRARLEGSRGQRTVVWHSMLSDGERLDAWRALASGDARIAVGARSAVFAPVRNLRLVIVDEEHEPAYKQEEAPRYHGRDAAVLRARLSGALAVLGSATPSLETVQNVRWGKYGRVSLPRRVDDRALPLLHLVDLRREGFRHRGPVVFSEVLADMLRDRAVNREQSILFLNRRGYSGTCQCRQCGHVVTCDHCSVSLTLHRTDNTLRCHLCGHVRPAPSACPSCRSTAIRWAGIGTQQVEEAARRLLPRSRIVRVDADAMARKNLLRQVLAEFRLGQIDVLVGTQMIAKGLDFPNVTLVGLVDADLSLHVPDFRAAERTFQLLVQVAGRAGRGDKAGEVVVQTFTPDAPPIQFAKRGEVDEFLEHELEIRAAGNYPPFRHLIRQVISGPNLEKVAFFAEHWTRTIREALGDRVDLRGPTPAPLEKLRDRYRFQVWFFVPRIGAVIDDLTAVHKAYAWPATITSTLDADPTNLS